MKRRDPITCACWKPGWGTVGGTAAQLPIPEARWPAAGTSWCSVSPTLPSPWGPEGRAMHGLACGHRPFTYSPWALVCNRSIKTPPHAVTLIRRSYWNPSPSPVPKSCWELATGYGASTVPQLGCCNCRELCTIQAESNVEWQGGASLTKGQPWKKRTQAYYGEFKQ